MSTSTIDLQAAVDNISQTFERPVIGIHNETSAPYLDPFNSFLADFT